MNLNDQQNNERLRPGRRNLLPDVVISVWNALTLLVETKPSEAEIEDAATELYTKLHSRAFGSFPEGHSSIPAVTSCPTLLRLHAISFDEASRRFSQKILKSYRVDSPRGRQDFLVDLFKVLRWMVAVTRPSERLHMVPGVRR